MPSGTRRSRESERATLIHVLLPMLPSPRKVCRRMPATTYVSRHESPKSAMARAISCGAKPWRSVPADGWAAEVRGAEEEEAEEEEEKVAGSCVLLWLAER